MRRLFFSDDEFNKVFSEKLKDFKTPVPNGLWGKINAKLDNQKPDRKGLSYWWLFPIAIVFVIALTINLSTNYNIKNISQSSSLLNIQRPILTKDNFNSFDKNSLSNKTSQLQKHKEIVTNAIFKNRLDIVLNDLDNVIESLNSLSDYSNTNYFDSETITPIAQLENKRTQDFRESNVEVAYNQSIYKSTDLINKTNCVFVSDNCSKYYFGLSYQAQSTTLLSNTTRKNPNLNNIFTISSGYGLVIGMNVRNNLALEFNPFLSSENQAYRSIITSKKSNATVKKSENLVKFNYIRIPISIKYKIPTKGTKSVCDESINLIGGLQYGYFKNGHTTFGDIEYDLTKEDVKQNDFQILAGIERSKSINQKLDIHIGLKASYGFTQIAADNSLRINELYKPHNFTTALFVKLTMSH